MTANWIAQILGGQPPAEGQRAVLGGRTLMARGGVLRDTAVFDPDQEQTKDTFGFKWAKRDTYASDAMRTASREWLTSRYGDLVARLGGTGSQPITVLDAGCGAGYSGGIAFEAQLRRLHYVGADISSAIDIARETISPNAGASLFVQGDLLALPFRPESFDIVFSEGVLHHTPSTEQGFASLAPLVRPGGLLAAYVYAKKSPAREFIDDHVRAQVSGMSPEAAWMKLEPLTRLGIALGKLDAEIEIDEDIEVLGIPKGRINVQRLFYWHFCKAYYRPELALDEMNHINFDWYMPRYCHRQTPGEVSGWCRALGLEIEQLKAEDAGITVICRRPGSANMMTYVQS
ncbi:MAG: class I SAM-dependent methyltransferase [Hyphomicrobiaceae bacterium]